MLFNKKCTDYIISLGYNCEIAHKFLKYYKFEISNLFNWTFSYSIDDLIKALTNFDLIGTGDYFLSDVLWECQNTHIKFHGKAPLQGYINNTMSKEEIDADKAELVSRVQYLKSKFLKLLKSEKTKIYVYKIKSADITESVHSKILELYNALKNLGAVNFELMVVAEKEMSAFFSEQTDKYIVKFVEKFPPDDNVVSKKYRNNGWNKIFSEFKVSKPKNYIRKKKYKYEIDDISFPEKYDLYFSLGQACSCTETLRKCRLQFSSYPFDWLYGASFLERIKILTSGFERWLEKDALEKVGENNLSAEPKHIYQNNYTGICFNHDFPQNVPLDESFAKVKNKYDRRIQRLLSHIEQSEKVLVVYLQKPDDKDIVEPEILIEGQRLLAQKFGDKINLLYLYCDESLSFKNRTVIDLSENVRCIKFDYNAHNKDVPYAVNRKVLISLFNKLKISNKHITFKNKVRRLVFKITMLFKGELWKKI